MGVCVCAHMIIPEGSLIPGGSPGTPPGLPYKVKVVANYNTAKTYCLEKWWESKLHRVAVGYRLLHSGLVLVPIESVCIKVTLREITPPTSLVVIPVCTHTKIHVYM